VTESYHTAGSHRGPGRVGSRRGRASRQLGLGRSAAMLLAMLLAGCAMAATASAESFVNRWTQVQIGVASGAPVAVAGAPSADWTIEPAGGGFVRLKNAASGGYLNVEKGPLAIGPVGPGWWSAQWTLEQAGGFVRIKNRWTGVYLNVEKGPLVAGAAEPGWWSAQWQVAAGQGGSAAATTPAASGAAATWSGKTWQAGSQNAMSSTGDITTNPTAILFSNGTQLPVRIAKDGVPGKWGFSDETGIASILEVTQPGANPVLLEGNTLCGAPVKYVSLWQEAQGGLYMIAFKGGGLPHGIDSDEVCAVYTYGSGG
jgi:hypothetical protein